MVLENISMDFATAIMKSFCIDGANIIRNNGNISRFLDELCLKKYQNENVEDVKNDFCVALGLYHFFVVNKTADYHLSAIQLLGVVPHQWSRFICDIYAMNLSYFPICVEIPTQILQEDLQDVMRKYNRGMITRMQQYLELLQQSNDVKCLDLYLQYRLMANEVNDAYNKPMKEDRVEE